MKVMVIAIIAVSVFAGCGKRQAGDGKASDVQSPLTNEMIDGKSGYIIEHARIAKPGDAPVVTIDGDFALAEGTGSVLIVWTHSEDQSCQTLLALELSGFVDGNAYEYRSDGPGGQFWVFGKVDGAAVSRRTGTIEGTVHAVKKAPSRTDPGIGRATQDGVGDIELVVSNIDAGSLKIDRMKKYAARFMLPILTLDEMRKFNTPAG